MQQDRVSTGVPGLNRILEGGFIEKKSYLYRGDAGTGKSTAGYHFLDDGLEKGESTLLITLGEPEKNVLHNSSAVNIDLSEVNIVDLSPGDTLYSEKLDYSVFPSSEVETTPLVDEVVKAMEKYKPKRVMLDSLTMLKYLNQDSFQYRNMVLSFIRYICSNEATLVMISESKADSNEDEAEFWVDGVINFIYSVKRRRMHVKKFRGSDFQSGYHSLKITGNGVKVFPRLQPGNFERKYESSALSFGIPEMDSMLQGGIERGTTTMISGPTGVGKTNLGMQFLKEAASRNERSVIYTFEESTDVIKKRSKSIGVPVDEMLDNGNLDIVYVEPFAYSPDEFSEIVQKDIEEKGTKVVMMDTIKSYSLSVKDEDSLERLHSLCRYMGNMGITVFLVSETTNVTGQFVTSDLNASYLADNIIFLRYLEIEGELKKAIGILKKRLSDFEKSIREFQITPEGIKVDKPLKNLRGIMTGLPESIDK